MSEAILARLLEHNNWANLQILNACIILLDEQLDFQPQSAVLGTIRETLHHLATSQEDYASMLIHFDHPPERKSELTLAKLGEIIEQSGMDLLSQIRDSSNHLNHSQIHLSDGYKVEPWVFIVQVINHATEHREQIKSIMTALQLEPPRIDGWMFGRKENALSPPSP